jgi:predicted transcriptional regulator
MSAEAPTSSEKALALEALERMPDSVTLEDICDELTILAAIRRGEADAAADRVVSHEDVKRRSSTWTSK